MAATTNRRIQYFNRAKGFKLEGCSFIDNSTGRTDPLSKVHVALRNEAACGASYDSIDRSKSPSATLPTKLAADITTIEPNNKDLVHNKDFVFLIHSTDPTDVREYGESVAKQCTEEGMPLASVFLYRRAVVFPADAKHRLVTTLAYQLVVSPYTPQALKIEILGALHLEPDLPERNLADQFDKLIVRPFMNVWGARDPALASEPKPSLAIAPVFLLDSVQNTAWETADSIVHELVHAVRELRGHGVNARVVITGVSYSLIVKAFEDSVKDGASAQIRALQRSAPTTLSYRAREFLLPVLEWKYGLPELAQRVIEVVLCMSVLIIGLGLLIFWLFMLLLPAPNNFLIATAVTPIAMMVIIVVLQIAIAAMVWQEIVKMIQPRAI